MLLLICGCSEPSYKINENGLTRNRPITEGFHLTEIDVSDFNDEDRPSKYEKGKSVFCGPINRFSGYLGGIKYSQKEKDLIFYNRQKMDTIMTLNNNKLGGEGHSKRINEWIDSQNTIDSIVNKVFPFEAQQEILFFQSNKNYKWVHTTKKGEARNLYDYSRKVLDTLPINIKTNQWYLLNFSNASNIIDKVFFKIKSDGEIQQYEHYQTIIGV